MPQAALSSCLAIGLLACVIAAGCEGGMDGTGAGGGSGGGAAGIGGTGGTAGRAGSGGSSPDPGGRGGAGTGGAGTAGSAGLGGGGAAGNPDGGRGGTGGDLDGGPSGAGGSAAGTGTDGAAGAGGGRGGSGGTAGGGTAGGGTAGGGTAGGVTAGGAGRGGTGGGAAGSGGRGGAAGGGTGGQASLPAGVSSLFPPPGGQALCADPPLRITFAASGSAAPAIGTAGRIRVLGAGGSAVATVDVAAATVSHTVGGMALNVNRPVFVDGNSVIVMLPPRALAYGQTYYVNVEGGALRAPGGAALSITDATTWRFSTAPGAPSDRAAIAVALDGSAPFCSVQGALDFIPANNTAAVTVTLAPGTYREIVYLSSKSNVTIQGQDRARTIIAGTNNNNLNAGTRARTLFGVDNATGLVVRNLTIHNLTPQGGSQAEALRLGSCDRCVVRDATIRSLQDTLLWGGRIYAKNCLIEGNVDYIWGDGAVYFDACEIKTVGRSGPIVQARNPASRYGYVFVDSKLTSDAGLTGGTLARIDVSAYPASHVAYINCQMSNVISAAGWQITGGGDTSMLRFWEYRSVDAAGNLLNVGGRAAGSRQLTEAQAAMMRDPAVVLGGWQPPRD